MRPCSATRHTSRYRYTSQPRVMIDRIVTEVPQVHLEDPVWTLPGTNEEIEGAQEGGQSPEYVLADPPSEEDKSEEEIDSEFSRSS